MKHLIIVGLYIHEWSKVSSSFGKHKIKNSFPLVCIYIFIKCDIYTPFAWKTNNLEYRDQYLMVFHLIARHMFRVSARRLIV